jgi:hypothetical protein
MSSAPWRYKSEPFELSSHSPLFEGPEKMGKIVRVDVLPGIYLFL